jgi:hypothetical protein
MFWICDGFVMGFWGHLRIANFLIFWQEFDFKSVPIRWVVGSNQIFFEVMAVGFLNDDFRIYCVFGQNAVFTVKKRRFHVVFDEFCDRLSSHYMSPRGVLKKWVCCFSLHQ